MVSYSANGKYAWFYGRKFTRDENTGYYLEAGVCDGKRQRLHVAVWEYFNGPVPAGMHIHHIDMDKGNNELGNLAMLTASAHARLHGENFTDEYRERLRDNMLNKAAPKAKDWHRSEEGRAWHRVHAMSIVETAVPADYICSACGRTFESLRHYPENENRFCGNNCKAAYRRKSGIDNEERTCEVCGKTFVCNRYMPTRTCSRSCGHKIRKNGGT